MDKVIIDGVDVSECSYYSSETYPYTCEVWDNECEAQNCYYKQLQRAKAENKELERKYADVLKLAKENADSNEYCLQELEQENEQLKADIESRTMCITCERELENCKLKAENERLKEATDGLLNIQYTLADSCKKYSEALQEIKEIANDIYYGIEEKNRILAKINEVIGAEE